jgi:hypothetical protein
MSEPSAPAAGVGVWFGVVAMVAGVVLALASGSSDALALGGSGLIVLGALCTAISFDDRTGT